VQRVIAYVDGFSLYYGLKGKGWEKYFWLDVDALARQLARLTGSIIAVKYFTAMVRSPRRDPGKRQRQARYIAALRTSPSVRVIYGRYK
jgi:uncharacterized LabA/DUF88 family protein